MSASQIIAPLPEIMRLWEEGLTAVEIAGELGVSRQCISQKLLDNGIKPRDRQLAKQERNRRDYLRLKAARKVARQGRQLQKQTRRTQLEELATQLGVTAWTLAGFADRTGPYRNPTTRTQQRKNMRLPNRYTPEGELLARQIKDIAAPWSPRHIVQNREKAAW